MFVITEPLIYNYISSYLDVQMKSRIKDKQKAIKLRLGGRSYSQIKKEINVSKSTLSVWLKNYPLSDKRIRELRDWNQQRIENYIKTRRLKKEKLLKEIYKQEKQAIFPLSKRDLFIAGLFLYWGEGTKSSEAQIAFANTDPAMIKFFVQWIQKSLNIPTEKIKVRLHLYQDMNIEIETNFWSKNLNIEKSQFRKPYIKDSRLSGLTYKNGFGHGTCNIMIGSAILEKKIMMGLKAIRDYFERV